MSPLEELYHITKKLEIALQHQVVPENRELIIEQVTELIDQRTIYIQKIAPPFTEDEMNLGKKIIVINKYIETQMTDIFAGLKIEMQQIRKQKKTNKSYTNPYEDVASMDGMFLDNKL